MNIKDLHTSGKPVSALPLFKTQEGNVTALQILANEQLKEHITKIPAQLICVTGEAVFENEHGVKNTLTAGDYVHIEANVKHWINATTTCNLILIK